MGEKTTFLSVLLTGLIFAIFGVTAFTACAGTGENYAEQAAQGADVFAGKNWNAPRRNNMYDRWEFGNDGTFHFWHIHHGEPLDRGVYRYELKDGIITITKEKEEGGSRYAYVFSGETVVLTPWRHGENNGAGEHAAAEHGATEHAPSGGRRMGALPEDPVTFTHAR
ncbi:MAG: hypothetical protein LBD71_02600 [Treponema sp.]|nr:hypothetical protein [Treponema sp.]